MYSDEEDEEEEERGTRQRSSTQLLPLAAGLELPLSPGLELVVSVVDEDDMLMFFFASGFLEKLTKEDVHEIQP